jgi:hypothetical protein
MKLIIDEIYTYIRGAIFTIISVFQRKNDDINDYSDNSSTYKYNDDNGNPVIIDGYGNQIVIEQYNKRTRKRIRK